jgi:hypothetical protein
MAPYRKSCVAALAEVGSDVLGAAEAEHEIRVVPATLVRTLGVGSRRTGTDQRDARILREASCRIDLPSVHVPTAVARKLSGSLFAIWRDGSTYESQHERRLPHAS